MKKRLRLTGGGCLLCLFVVSVPGLARADSVEDKIAALEERLERLKIDQAQARQEQMEIKKEATAATTALPSFSYRPGRGITIEAADRAWSMGVTYEFMTVMYNHLDGNDRRGATTGDLFFRRNRPYFIFCLNNCFYEWGIGQWLKVDFPKINPLLPELHVGDAIAGPPYASTIAFTPAGHRSSTRSAILESSYDLLPDSDVDQLARRAIALFWHAIPVGPGDFSFAAEYKPGAGVILNTTSDTDRKQLQTSLMVRPFSRSKNYWLEGLRFGGGLQTDAVDSRSAARGRQLRIRTFERVGRQTLFDTGSTTIGDGVHDRWETGLDWGLGPYRAGTAAGWSNYEGRNDTLRGVHGNYWHIWHELFLWSPKGPFTGSSSTFGSVQAGWGFGRADADCGEGSDCAPGSGSFNSNRLLARELGLYYYIRPAMRVGVNWYWYSSANTPLTVQQAIGCTTGATDPGKSCDWHTINLVLNANF
ncbi:MAG: hypothetical protein HYY46_22155 [Deltaproteobacteria bacterium]|nr:hypothetical protein [Deltaproteobacteria bacterium]